MTFSGWLQIGLFLVVLLLLVKPLGGYMARIYQGEPNFATRIFGPAERWIYRVCGIDPKSEMTWKTYAVVMLFFNLAGFVLVFLILLLQPLLPFNPQNLAAVRPDLAFNVAVSFVSNTNWQSYSGETTMSYFTQMIGLTVQNFLSAATGIAVLIALVRGLARHTTKNLGNYWVDMTRTILYVLLPLSLILALVLASQGVVQTLAGSQKVALLQPVQDSNGQMVAQQDLALGPAASQIAIKQLGTNGGGFFNANSAHPFENPTPLTNFLELLSILLIPAALCFTFGKMIGDTRKGWALLATMTIIFVIMLGITIWFEQGGNPALARLNVDQTAGDFQSGGNMEGKEVRLGISNSALWATATSAASNGSVNSAHDSFTPVGGLVPLWLMQLGEVVYGGVGSGLYGIMAFVIMAVFVAGLMIGRTPEYSGKKIEVFEMKMASLMVIVPIMAVLFGTAIALLIPSTRDSIFNPGPHGFSEVLYAFSSAANNNGSAFAGLNANTPFFNIALALVMLLGRYAPAVAALAIAGSLVLKKKVPETSGTLPSHTPLFVFWLIAIIIMVGALSYIPALSLGPVAEQLMR